MGAAGEQEAAEGERFELGRVAEFVLVCLGMSWPAAALLWASGASWANPVVAGLFGVLYMYFPFLAALVVARRRGERVAEAIGWPPRWSPWLFVASLLPVAVAFAALGVSLLLPGVRMDWEMNGLFERFGGQLSEAELAQMRAQIEALPVHPLFLTIPQGLIAGATVNAVAAFGEEAGWRGYLQREVRGLGFWRGALLVGGVWGLWHAPLILMGHNYPQHPVLGVGMMVVFCALWAPLFAWIRERSGSVLGPSILHGTLNATVGVSFMTLAGGNELTVGALGVAGFAVLAVANLLLALLARPEGGGRPSRRGYSGEGPSGRGADGGALGGISGTSGGGT